MEALDCELLHGGNSTHDGVEQLLDVHLGDAQCLKAGLHFEHLRLDLCLLLPAVSSLKSSSQADTLALIYRTSVMAVADLR